MTSLLCSHLCVTPSPWVWVGCVLFLIHSIQQQLFDVTALIRVSYTGKVMRLSTRLNLNRHIKTERSFLLASGNGWPWQRSNHGKELWLSLEHERSFQKKAGTLGHRTLEKNNFQHEWVLPQLSLHMTTQPGYHFLCSLVKPWAKDQAKPWPQHWPAKIYMF